MWDNSWDIITNENYLTTPANMGTYYSNDPFKVINEYTNNIEL